jgi:hypothetical protein
MAELKDRIEAVVRVGLYEPTAYHIERLVLLYKRCEFLWKHPEATRKEVQARIHSLWEIYDAKIEWRKEIRVFGSREFGGRLARLKTRIEFANHTRDCTEYKFVEEILDKRDWMGNWKVSVNELIHILELEDKYTRWGVIKDGH